MKKQLKDKQGTCQQARIAIDAKASVEIDGQKQDFNFKYDVTITIEQIEFAIQQIGNVIANIGNKLAA